MVEPFHADESRRRLYVLWVINTLKSCWNVISGWFMFLLTLIANHWLFFLIFSGVSLVLSIIGCAAMITYLPPDYFNEAKQIRQIKNPVLRVMFSTLKNLIGFMLIVVGALLAVPGVPGQGLLTILTGLIISDFPGRKRLAHRIIRIPAVLLAANKIRTNFGRLPLVIYKD